MKTAELTDALLDLWVAKAEGSTDARVDRDLCESSHNAFERVPFRPSSYWGDGGPLIEKYRPCLEPTWPTGGWYVRAYDKPCDGDQIYGATPLIAICRAVVRSVYGDEVPE